MSRYRKRPIEIEARRLTSDVLAAADIARFCNGQIANYREIDGCDYFDGIDIVTLEGTMRADVGDWIIRGVKGEFYPCKPDIFEATYEAVA
jgi:hypothetical protein